MPSRAEMRKRGEEALRAIVIAILGVMLWLSLHPVADVRARNLTARDAGVRNLAEWSAMSAAPSAIQLALDSVPSPINRAWLGAIAGAGTRVQWKGNLPALMVDAQPISAPTGGTAVRIASSRSPVALSDDAGALDTLRAAKGGGTIVVDNVVGVIAARSSGAAGSTISRDSALLRKVLVLGTAGWETKFMAAALEEAGWKVDAAVRVAPGVQTTQGPAALIDTARYSAVVAVDAGAAPYAARLAEFVRSGGGVVMGPGAAALDAMSSIRAGAVGRASSGSRPASGGTVDRTTLNFLPLTPLRGDAVTLEARNGATTVAARRVGAGRVLQLGYEDTWRWRISGGDGAVRDHRRWLSGLVSSVAYAPRVSRSIPVETDEAPVADFVGAVGVSPSASFASTAPSRATNWLLPLFVLLSLMLVSEIGSRRLRGAA